jgi:hypothetical protein
MKESPMHVLRLTTEDAKTWSQVGDRAILVSDLVDQATVPEAKMTVGFARVAKGEALDISFPYDEVLILTKGSYTVAPSTVRWSRHVLARSSTCLPDRRTRGTPRTTPRWWMWRHCCIWRSLKPGSSTRAPERHRRCQD